MGTIDVNNLNWFDIICGFSFVIFLLLTVLSGVIYKNQSIDDLGKNVKSGIKLSGTCPNCFKKVSPLASKCPSCTANLQR